jgi:copper transport accessory protein
MRPHPQTNSSNTSHGPILTTGTQYPPTSLHHPIALQVKPGATTQPPHTHKQNNPCWETPIRPTYQTLPLSIYPRSKAHPKPQLIPKPPAHSNHTPQDTPQSQTKHHHKEIPIRTSPRKTKRNPYTPPLSLPNNNPKRNTQRKHPQKQQKDTSPNNHPPKPTNKPQTPHPPSPTIHTSRGGEQQSKLPHEGDKTQPTSEFAQQKAKKARRRHLDKTQTTNQQHPKGRGSWESI